MFKIDKGVPLPPNSGNKGKGSRKYPFDDMQVGDSIFFETEYPNQRRELLWSVLTSYQKRNGMKYATRIVDGGVRVWRVA